MIWVVGPFTDNALAKEYRDELLPFDDDEVYDGCRWSIIYILCGITLLLIAVNALLQLLGTWNHKARAVSSCFASVLTCLNLCAIVTTGVFRFNTIGKWAALSLTPSKYDQPFDLATKTMVISSLSDEHTYNSDGKLIAWLFIAQIAFCCTHCCVTSYSAKPPAMNGGHMEVNYDQLTHTPY